MKCPQCARNHKRSVGMICSCGYRFIFDPKASQDQLTDNKFQAILDRASAHGTYWFTMNQLWYQFCLSVMGSPRTSVIVAVVAGIAALVSFVMAIVIQTIWLVAAGCFALFVVVVATIDAVLKSTRAAPSLQQVEEHVKRWKSGGRSIDRLIEKPTLGSPPPEWKEKDIYDYGVERILFVERDLLVDWLVLNELHTSNRTLVIAESGYPKYLVPVVRRLLAESPELPVYLLHDSTKSGQDMRLRIRDSKLFDVGERPIVDLGLAPRDVERLDRLRCVRPDRVHHQVPVDVLAIGVLSLAIEQAFVEGIPFTALLERRDQGIDDSGSFG